MEEDMPYRMVENADGTYKVINAETGKVHAKKTSKKNAAAQIRVMQMAEHAGGMMGRKSGK